MGGLTGLKQGLHIGVSGTRDMFCTCPNCKGGLLTVAPDGFNMIRCKCTCGWVDEFEIRRPLDDLWELIDGNNNTDRWSDET